MSFSKIKQLPKLALSVALIPIAGFYMSAIAQTAAPTPEAKPVAPPGPTVERGKQIASAVCVACHGIDGNSPAAANPNLAGQGEQYIAAQLKAFKEAAAAGDKARRVNAVMQGFAANLSDNDMKSLGMYYSRQTIKPAVARDKDLVQKGEKIYRAGVRKNDVPACAGCHGAAGQGIPAQYPRVAGQYPDYLHEQLEHYAKGSRKNNQMNVIASRLSPEELRAVSEYMAGMRAQ
jgi:cytochrome c553